MAVWDDIIDFSGWQGVVDWDAVLASGVGAVYIRASHGKNKDAYLDRNRTELERLKIPFGVYHYASPAAGLTWKVQAEFFAGLVCGNLPPIFDLETNGSSAAFIADDINGPVPMNAGQVEIAAQNAMLVGGLSKGDLDGWCQKFIDRFQTLTGKKLGLYSSKYLLDTLLPRNDWVKKMEPFWLALWNYDPNLPVTRAQMPLDRTPPANPDGFPYTFHQYSNKIVVPGISSVVDGNAFNGTKQQFEGKFRVIVPVVTPPPPPPPPTDFPKPMHFASATLNNSVNIRTSPDASNNRTDNIVGAMKYPAKPIAFEEKILDAKNKWVRIGSNMWSIQTLNGVVILAYD